MKIHQVPGYNLEKQYTEQMFRLNFLFEEVHPKSQNPKTIEEKMKNKSLKKYRKNHEKKTIEGKIEFIK